MPDQAPWQKYQQPAGQPWEKYAAPAADDTPKPWEKYQQPDQAAASAAPRGGVFERGAHLIADWWNKSPSWATQYGTQYEKESQEFKEQGPKALLSPENIKTQTGLLSGFSGSGALPSVKLPAAAAAQATKQVQKFLSPQSVSPAADEAAASIRAAGGQAARDTETTKAALEPFHAIVNALPEPDRLAFIDYVEGGTAHVDPKLKPLADTLKTELEKRKAKLQALPDKAQMDFVDDYYPHHWQDPNAAQAVINDYRGGAGKQGSGASLKARSIPTIAEGIKRGLTPVTTNPIEATMRYISSMDRFIAAQTVLDEAKANGTIKYVRPQTVGASGHPDSFKVPAGHVELHGRGATDATGAKAYAPEDWARVYNNYISRGFHELNADFGNAVDAFQRASNAVTGLELGLSGYHAFTMAKEAVISDVARAVSNIAGGKIPAGLKALGTAVVAPVRGALLGKKFEQVYLDRSPGSPGMRKIADLLTEAGGRGVGKNHAPDYGFSAAGSFMTAWKRGALKQQMADQLAGIKGPWTGAKALGSIIGRTMETISQPLFEKYIPRLKNAAFYDTMSDWLAANPNATHAEQVSMARKLVDSMDDRFGEMIQDNIFWHKAMKQTAQIALRSYSWNLGTARTIGGGLLSAAKDPKRLSITHPEHDPRVAYIVGMAITAPLVGMIYQYLKTGEGPNDIRDLVAPRTGGTAPGFGGRGSVPERAMLPGYEKDVFGWLNDPAQEAKNKQSKLLQIIEETASGKDWQGHPIADPKAAEGKRLEQYLWHVMQSLTPISVQTLAQGHKKGSNLGVPASLMGVRPAPAYIQDPKGTQRGLQRLDERAYKAGVKSERRQQRQYGGPQE